MTFRRATTIAGTSFLLLLGAAALSDRPASFSSDTGEQTRLAMLTDEGPVVAASEPEVDAAASLEASRKAELRERGAHIKFVAMYGDPAQMTIPSTNFSQEVDEETLWLARAIYSETKVKHEQELIAWVIRNRVENEYRGNDTYREVVLDPYQFSAFNPGRPTRSYYANLTPSDSVAGWQSAVRIANYVRHATDWKRPLPEETMYFFSERSMPGYQPPHWAHYHQRVAPTWSYPVDQRRFRFYKGSSS